MTSIVDDHHHVENPGYVEDSSYVEDHSPGAGARTPARAWLATDAPELSLNGEWQFRLHASHHGLSAPAAGDAEGWETISVPSHWVLGPDGALPAEAGRGRPIYTNVQFPFPVDPPWVPDENPTADHRRTFEHPGWEVERVLLRFDGVESVYRVWLNGTEIGVGKGSRLVQEFDVSAALLPGENELVVRVHQWSSMSYVEDQDQWWLPGIFRDVTLLGRPAGALDDVWLRTDLAPDGHGTLQPLLRAEPAAYPVTVRVPELGFEQSFADAAALTPVDLGPVAAWSAETPRLYTAEVVGSGETVTVRVGFRHVQIVGDQFTVNGASVRFRGVNRHETHPVRGRVFDEAHARADMITMKRANINAIRTSHYPPHPRVLDLADELGFWVIDECDLETHGFEHLGWVDNPSDDPRWAAVYADRIERTVERDKNHPCVVIWSLGNESGTGRNLAANAQWVRRRDPGRPVHYEGDYTCAYTDVYSRMYPSLVEVEAIGRQTGGIRHTTSPAESSRVRSKPFLMCEYVHAMGNGPGAVAEYEALAERYPRLHGGFVWEWRDHGLLTHSPDGTPYYGYGGDFDEVVHDGNFVMDGMLLPDDSATPAVADFAAVHAPVRFALTGDELTVRNHAHTVGTGHLRFVVARLDAEGSPTEQQLSVPEVAAGDVATVTVPGELTAGSGAEAWLEVRAELASEQPWAPAGFVVARQQWALPASPAVVTLPRPGLTEPVRAASGEVVELGPAVFDAGSGRLRSLHGLAVDGPRLELWRAPTDNDRGASFGSYESAAPEDTPFGVGQPGPSSAERWSERGLDRLVHRQVELRSGTDEVVSVVRVSAANSGLFVDVTYRWQLVGEGLACFVDLVPTVGWDCTWPRVGVRLDLPAGLDRADWFGTGPHEAYPDTAGASLVGRFSAGIDQLNVAYSRPQETGHRPALRSLTVSEDGAERLRLRTLATVDGRRPGFTLSRHTPQQVAAAGHPYELPGSTHTYLFLDAAVHGVGSRACGMDVLPEHALWPGAHQFGLVFEPPQS